MPAHGVGEGALIEVVVLGQQLLHGITQVWGTVVGERCGQ